MEYITNITFTRTCTHACTHLLTHTHMLDLINLTNDPHCSMVSLADLLFERLKNTSWVVVFKNLVTTHNLMTLGNEVSPLHVLREFKLIFHKARV